MNIVSSYPMWKATTFKCGGRADWYVEPETEIELNNLLKFHKGKSFFILGNGSNTLFVDEGFAGLVICTKRLDRVSFCIGTKKYTAHISQIFSSNLSEKNDIYINMLQNHLTALAYGDEFLLECEAGVDLFLLNKFCCEYSLSGLEFSFGIPGTVGGAVVMNSGAFGGQFSDVVKSAIINIDGQNTTFMNEDMKFGYRSSKIKNSQNVLISTTLCLKKGIKNDILNSQTTYINQRKAKQPIGVCCAGSVFKRNGDIIPAKLIEELGLKGFKIGGAEVSSKHAGFIINNGSATASDILNLVKLIQSQVYDKFGVKLEMEIVVAK